MPQGRDPTQPRITLQMGDLGLGQQAPVPHQHHPLQPELLAQPLHLVRNRSRVSRVAGIGLDRHRSAHPIRHHPVDHDGSAALAVPVVAVPHQGTGAAFVVAAAHVIENVVPFGLGGPVSSRCAPGVAATSPWPRTGRSHRRRESSDARVVVCQSRVVASLEAGSSKR